MALKIWVQSKKHHFMNWKMGHKKEMGDGSKNEQIENILFIAFPQRLLSNGFKNYGPSFVTQFNEELSQPCTTSTSTFILIELMVNGNGSVLELYIIS